MTKTVVSSNLTNTVVDTRSTTTIVTDKQTTVVADGRIPIVVLSGQMGPPGAAELSMLNDIDLTTLPQSDSLLMYDSVSSKWKASKKLEDHLVNAGFF